MESTFPAVRWPPDKALESSAWASPDLWSAYRRKINPRTEMFDDFTGVLIQRLLDIAPTPRFSPSPIVSLRFFRMERRLGNEKRGRANNQLSLGFKSWISLLDGSGGDDGGHVDRSKDPIHALCHTHAIPYVD